MKDHQRATLSTNIACIAGLSVVLCYPSIALSEDNMSFKGTLVAEPCVIAMEDAKTTVDFGTIVDKFLYINGQSPKVGFTLKVSECDTEQASLATVTFTGTESSGLPGYILPDADSIATGIAIGIERDNGNLLMLNQPQASFRLEKGQNLFGFQSFVKGEPAAIAGKTIGRGDFSATATFAFTYE